MFKHQSQWSPKPPRPFCLRLSSIPLLPPGWSPTSTTAYEAPHHRPCISFPRPSLHFRHLTTGRGFPLSSPFSSLLISSPWSTEPVSHWTAGMLSLSALPLVQKFPGGNSVSFGAVSQPGHKLQNKNLKHKCCLRIPPDFLFYY